MKLDVVFVAFPTWLSPPLASSAVLQTWILAWVGTPAPYQRWRLAPWVYVRHSLGQPLIGKPLPSRPVHEAIQPLQSVALHVAVIETEGELVNVSTEMLRAGVMVDANQAALENGEDALNSVRGYIVADKLVGAVVAL
jgi:hypothetical protein